jgi:magnesium transporter
VAAELEERVARHYLATAPAAAARVLDAGPAEDAAQALVGLNADSAARILAQLGDDAARATLLATDAMLVARWLALLDRAEKQELLALLPARRAEEVQKALEFPPGTAGRLMDPAVLSLHEDATREQVFERIRAVRGRRVTDVMVCDSEGRLQGTVPLQEVVGAAPGTALRRLAVRDSPHVLPMATRDDVVGLLNRHRLASVPVLDFDGYLLGIIRFDNLVLAAQQAATDDLQQMVGASKEERALSPAGFTVRSRLPWLLVNLLTAFLAAAVVGLFDETIARFTALAVLLPVVAGQSGNAGAQALAVTSRGLALREIRLRHWWRVTRKESTAAFVNGIAVAAVTSAGVLWWSGNVALAGVIGASMVASVVLAAIAGAMIPVLLTSLGRDPATASSIVLTTVTDVVGFSSFLGLATLAAGALGSG